MTGQSFRSFGDPGAFAFEYRLCDDPDEDRYCAAASVGSWGEWRIWIAGQNLCRMEIETAGGRQEMDRVRWYLAPLFRWLVENRDALLHESRLPGALASLGGRDRWARSSYLNAMRVLGDSHDFSEWQSWGQRHSVRACAEGGIYPDLFFQRVRDEMEVSWGDRIQPGAESATFALDDGGARAGIVGVAEALGDAAASFQSEAQLQQREWHKRLGARLNTLERTSPETKLSWFLDSRATPGPLCALLQSDEPSTQTWLIQHERDRCLAPLAPAVAMFGALSPQISETAATRLLACLLKAKTDTPEAPALSELVESRPAWASDFPWSEGYSLALEVLEELDTDRTSDRFDLDGALKALSVDVIKRSLGEEGPRGVALAGGGYRPTIVVNPDNAFNIGVGTRFSIAHELCHILYDRDKSQTVFQASTPWSHPSVEQRANAFAAMLLMPPYRLGLESRRIPTDAEIRSLAKSLGTSKTALRRHLANLGVIEHD